MLWRVFTRLLSDMEVFSVEPVFSVFQVLCCENRNSVCLFFISLFKMSGSRCPSSSLFFCLYVREHDSTVERAQMRRTAGQKDVFVSVQTGWQLNECPCACARRCAFYKEITIKQHLVWEQDYPAGRAIAQWSTGMQRVKHWKQDLDGKRERRKISIDNK